VLCAGAYLANTNVLDSVRARCVTKVISRGGDSRSPALEVLSHQPRLFLSAHERHFVNIGVDLDWEFELVTHAEFCLRQMLDEDVQSVLNLELGILSRVCEHLYHVSHVRVQVVNRSNAFVISGKLEVDCSILASFFAASLILDLVKILLFLKRSWATLNSDCNLPGKFYLEGLDWLFASAVVHVDGDTDLFTWTKSAFLESNSCFGFRRAKASNSSDIDGQIL